MLAKVIKIVAGAVILLAITALAIYNFRCNDEFFTMSLFNLFMLIISIGVAYFLVQRKIDERRYQDGQIKVIEAIIGDIQENMSSDILFNNWDDYLMKRRAINDKISVLKQVCCRYNSQLLKDVEYIENRFNQLKELYEDIDSKYTRKGIAVPPDHETNIRALADKIVSKAYSLWANSYAKN